MAKKFDFLSPGIEIREIDQSFIPQEREAEGPIMFPYLGYQSPVEMEHKEICGETAICLGPHMHPMQHNLGWHLKTLQSPSLELPENNILKLLPTLQKQVGHLVDQ